MCRIVSADKTYTTPQDETLPHDTKNLFRSMNFLLPSGYLFFIHKRSISSALCFVIKPLRLKEMNVSKKIVYKSISVLSNL